MAVFGLFVGASCVLLIHLRLALLLLCLGPSHRVRLRDMRGISFEIGEYGEDMAFRGYYDSWADMTGKFGSGPRLRGCGGSKRGGSSLGGSLDLNMSRA
jgi:hypothetical protein